MDIYMNPNLDNERNIRNNNRDNRNFGGDIGYIKCYVEGYMYLNIKKSEFNKYK